MTDAAQGQSWKSRLGPSQHAGKVTGTPVTQAGGPNHVAAAAADAAVIVGHHDEAGRAEVRSERSVKALPNSERRIDDDRAAGFIIRSEQRRPEGKSVRRQNLQVLWSHFFLRYWGMSPAHRPRRCTRLS